MSNKSKKIVGLIILIISFILIVIISVNLKFIGENNKKNDEVIITLSGNGITSLPADNEEIDTNNKEEIIDIEVKPLSEILINEKCQTLVPGDTLSIKYQVINNSNTGVEITENINFELLNKNETPFLLAPVEDAFALYYAEDIGYSFETGYIVKNGAEPLNITIEDNILKFNDIKRNMGAGTYLKDYVFIFKKDAGNIYKNLLIKISVIVEASNN